MKGLFGSLLWLSIVLSACGAGGSAAPAPTPMATASVPSPTPTATALPSVMPAATTTRTPTTTPAYRSTLQSTADSLLLSLGDMHIGWTAQQPVSGTTSTRIIPREGVCGQALNPVAPLARSETLFIETRWGPFVKQIVAIFPSGTGAQAFNNEVSRWTCTEWVQMSDTGRPATWHSRLIPFPKLGDGALAVRMTARDAPGFGTAEFDVVIFRKGDVQNVIINGGPGIYAVNSILTESAARTALAKIP